MRLTRPRTAAFVLAIAVVTVASWLVAGPGASSAPSAAIQETGQPTSENEPTPLPDFQPTEKLPAGSAVAFPTDI